MSARKEQLLTNLLGAGLDSGLAQKAFSLGFNLSKLKGSNESELQRYFDETEIQKIQSLKRKPISPDVIKRLIDECDWKCCVCAKFDEFPPIIIHHIEEHSTTQDDSYENLVILCLNHHGVVHTTHHISRHPMRPELLRGRKQSWIEQVAKYKAGNLVPEKQPVRLQNELDYIESWIAKFDLMLKQLSLMRETNNEQDNEDGFLIVDPQKEIKPIQRQLVELEHEGWSAVGYASEMESKDLAQIIAQLWVLIDFYKKRLADHRIPGTVPLMNDLVNAKLAISKARKAQNTMAH